MLRSSAGSNPAGKRTVAPARLSSMGGRAAASVGFIPGLGVTAAADGSMLTGSIVANDVDVPGLGRGSHFRMTLALMPWLRAIAETEAPGTWHWAMTSLLNLRA